MKPAEEIYLQCLLDEVEPGWVLTSSDGLPPWEITGVRGDETLSARLKFNGGDCRYFVTCPERLERQIGGLRPARRRVAT